MANHPIAPLERVVNVAQAEFDTVLMDLGSQFSSEWSPILQLARMILLVTEKRTCQLCGPSSAACRL